MLKTGVSALKAIEVKSYKYDACPLISFLCFFNLNCTIASHSAHVPLTSGDDVLKNTSRRGSALLFTTKTLNFNFKIFQKSDS